MSNPFSFFSRRDFLRASVFGVAAASPLSRAIAAVPVSAKIFGAPSAFSFAVAVSASVKVNAYVEYGFTKSSLAGKTATVGIAQGATSNFTISGLKANSQVFYRVRYAIGASKNFASLTQRVV